jgi:hypothetical protein
MQPRILEQIPRFGWNTVDLSNSELDPIVNTTTGVIERPGGLLRASLSGVVPLAGATGTGRFTFVVEGSQFGDTTNAAEWEILAELSANELFFAPSPLLLPQFRLLGSQVNPILALGFRGEGQVSLGRFKFLRVRTFVVDEDPFDPVDYTLSARFTGIGGDGESMERTTVLTKTAGFPIALSDFGAPFRRPEGTRYMTAQVLVDDMILDPPATDGYLVLLQGALSQKALDASEWFTIDFTSVGGLVAPGDAQVFKQGQIGLIDMGPFEFFRFIPVVAVGSPPNLSGILSSFRMTCVATFDDNDWLDGDIGLSRLNESLQETFCQVTFANIQPQSGNERDIEVQILDINGRPLNATREIGIVLSDGPDAPGQLAPSATATVTAIADSSGTGAAFIYPAGGGAAEVLIKLDSNGTAILTVDDGAAPGTYFIEAFNRIADVSLLAADDQFGPGQVLIATTRFPMVFT